MPSLTCVLRRSWQLALPHPAPTFDGLPSCSAFDGYDTFAKEQLMKLNRLIPKLILFALSLTITEPAQSDPTLFARLTNPTGVAVDQAGNVYVQSLSLLGNGGLFKFDSNGVLQAQNSNLLGKFRFAPDPLFHNLLWAQEISGKLYLVNTDTLQAQLFMDLRAWAMDHNMEPALNMLTGKQVNLLMVSPNFGDIATRQLGADQLDLFIIGLTSSGGGIPFVLRLRFKNQILDSTKIIVASIPYPTVIIPPPLDTYPYGISVNANGTVLTALPSNISGGTTPLFLAMFGADFPDTVDSPPVFVPKYKNKQAFAIGMTASGSNGGFYVATVANGFGCGAGPAILYFSPALDLETCVADLSSLGLGNVAPADIAIEPNNRFIYVAMTQIGMVLRLDLPTPPPNAGFQLSINKLGTGTVTSSPPGINCGSDCDENYASGTVVALTAAAAPGSTFAGWGGDADCADGQVTMSAAKACTATFNLTPTVFYTLAVSLGGTGSGGVTSNPAGINCGSDCDENYASGTVVTLTATPASGSTFAGWSGACGGTGACQVTLSAAANVAANFTANQPPDAKAECLLDWAEQNYPALFAPAGSSTVVSTVYTYRHYPATNAYLGVSSIDNHVYYLGLDGKFLDEGALSFWLPKAGCPSSGIDCLLNWAEANYPALFAPAGPPTAVWGVHTYRLYSASNAYLGISSADNHVYYKGVDGFLLDEGEVSHWLPIAGCP